MGRHSISEFQLRQLIVEYRYDNAFLIWDRAGHVWERVRQQIKNLESQSVQPNQTSFHGDGRYSLNLGIDKAACADNAVPRTFDEDAAAKVHFFAAVVEELRIEVLTRIGTRVIFAKPCADESAAHEEARSFGLMRVPQEQLFGIKPEDATPTYAVEVNDGDLGYIARINVQKREVTFQPPPEAHADLESKSFTKFDLLVDVDFYTRKPTNVASFQLAGWLNKWRRAVNRDIETLLNLGQQ